MKKEQKGRIAFVDGSGHCHNAGGTMLQRSFGADRREQRVFALATVRCLSNI